jgi:hypothetical protein
MDGNGTSKKAAVKKDLGILSISEHCLRVWQCRTHAVQDKSDDGSGPTSIIAASDTQQIALETQVTG